MHSSICALDRLHLERHGDRVRRQLRLGGRPRELAGVRDGELDWGAQLGGEAQREGFAEGAQHAHDPTAQLGGELGGLGEVHGADQRPAHAAHAAAPRGRDLLVAAPRTLQASVNPGCPASSQASVKSRLPVPARSPAGASAEAPAVSCGGLPRELLQSSCCSVWLMRGPRSLLRGGVGASRRVPSSCPLGVDGAPTHLPAASRVSAALGGVVGDLRAVGIALDDLGDAQAELLVDDHHLAAGDGSAVDQQIHRFAGEPLERDDRAGAQLAASRRRSCGCDRSPR